MKATKKLITILSVVAVGMAAAAIGLYTWEPEVDTDFVTGSLLVQGVNPETIHKVTVKKGSDDVTLVRQGKGFVVEGKHSYPADPKSVNELFFKVMDIRCQSLVTEDADYHTELGVEADKPEEGSIAMFDKDGTAIAKVLVGTKPEHGGGPHVRLEGKNRVYIAENGLWLNTTATSFMETKVVDISKDKIQKVAVKTKSDSYTILNKANKGELQGVPTGKKAKQSDVDSVFGALSYFSFTDVLPLEDAGISWEGTYVCTLKKHLTYAVNVGKKANKHYVRITATGPSKAIIQKQVNEVNAKAQTGQKLSDDEMKKKDEILMASKEADTFNKAHGMWAYEISEYNAKNLKKPLGELIEDDDPDNPEEIAASHILVSYKGASRADAAITRSKAEAKNLAEDLVKQAKAPGADFGALAKDHSDGPSKTKGGDLGTFGKGNMDKNFEAAAWKLKVGEISSVVETPFGFHIIKRTK